MDAITREEALQSFKEKEAGKKEREARIGCLYHL